jgi:hypothetical protein
MTVILGWFEYNKGHFHVSSYQQASGHKCVSEIMRLVSDKWTKIRKVG